MRGAVFQNGCVLLVRESEDGLLAFPGGWPRSGRAPPRGIGRARFAKNLVHLVKAVKLLAC